MSNIITKYVENEAKKVAKGKLAEVINPKQKFVNDPHILNAQTDALKKQKKHWWKKPQNTPSIILSERDRYILRSVKKRAVFLDKGCDCCCFTFGFDFIIGFIPIIGDFIGLLLGLELVKKASEAGIPNHLKVQMVSNVFVDFLIGMVPIIGDFLDAIVKSNWRNAMIFEDYIMLRRRDELLKEQALYDQQRITELSNGDDLDESEIHSTSALIDSSHYHHHHLNNNSNDISSSSSSSMPAALHRPTDTTGGYATETVILEVDQPEVTPDKKKENKYGTFFRF